VHADHFLSHFSKDNMGGVLMTAFAIVAHDWTEGMAISVMCVTHGLSFGCGVISTSVCGTMSMLGVVLGFLLTDVWKAGTGELLASSLVCFAGGLFLYISLLDMVYPQLREGKRSLWKTLTFTGIVVLVSLVSFFL